MTIENIKIEDNFLAQGDFDNIHERLVASKSASFPWYLRYRYYAGDGNELDSYQFTHTLYEYGAPYSSDFQYLDSLIDLLQPMTVWRITANLLTRLPILVENEFHVDMPELSIEEQKNWTTAVLYMNTNDGYTEFEDGTKIESVANRFVSFPTNWMHRGTSCTDQQTRVIINFNYFK